MACFHFQSHDATSVIDSDNTQAVKKVLALGVVVAHKGHDPDMWVTEDSNGHDNSINVFLSGRLHFLFFRSCDSVFGIAFLTLSESMRLR